MTRYGEPELQLKSLCVSVYTANPKTFQLRVFLSDGQNSSSSVHPKREAISLIKNEWIKFYADRTRLEFIEFHEVDISTLFAESPRCPRSQSSSPRSPRSSSPRSQSSSSSPRSPLFSRISESSPRSQSSSPSPRSPLFERISESSPRSPLTQESSGVSESSPR